MNRKCIAFLLAIMMLLVICACGKDRAPVQQSEVFVSATLEPIPTPTAEPVPGTVTLEEPIVIPIFDDAAQIPMPETDANLETTTPTGTGTDNSTDNANNTSTTPVPNATTSPIDTGSFGSIPNSTAYEKYNNMSGTDQMAFMESFDSIESFVAWYNAAQSEYNSVNNAIEVTNGTIDLGELLGETTE